MHIAALVKQVPVLDSIAVDANGRPRFDPADLAMDPLSRRAVAQGVELAAAVGDGLCTALTVGPPSADDVLREAIAWGRTCSVVTDGLLLSDPAFVDGDALATARTLAAAINREGPFDLILLGASSSDADTGQLGPQLAELLDLPFAACARYLSMQGSRLHVRCERDDGWMQVTLALPALVSCAAGLINPCEMPPTARATVPDDRIRTVTAADLGPGPWGRDASPTSIRSMRAGEVAARVPDAQPVPPSRGIWGSAIGVVASLGDPEQTRRVFGAAAQVAAAIDGHVVALTAEPPDASALGSWGADAIVAFQGEVAEEDAARALSDWIEDTTPWAVIAPASAWGREVLGRAAARIGAGLAGNVTALAVDDDRLVASKAAYSNRVVAEIVAASTVQMATVYTEGLPLCAPRDATAPDVQAVTVRPRGRVRVVSRTRGGGARN